MSTRTFESKPTYFRWDGVPVAHVIVNDSPPWHDRDFVPVVFTQLQYTPDPGKYDAMKDIAESTLFPMDCLPENQSGQCYRRKDGVIVPAQSSDAEEARRREDEPYGSFKLFNSVWKVPLLVC